MAIHYLPISWKIYHETARKLAAAILDHSDPFDKIVTISRGGLTLGHLLSDLLRVPVSTITIQSYMDIQTQGEVQITERLRTRIHGKRVLLVDDVSDSGKTFIRAIKYLKHLSPKKLLRLPCFINPIPCTDRIILPDKQPSGFCFPMNRRK